MHCICIVKWKYALLIYNGVHCKFTVFLQWFYNVNFRKFSRTLSCRRVVTTSEKKQPAGDGPGKSIEKFEKKSPGRCLEVEQEKRRVAEFALGEHVVTSSSHTKRSRNFEWEFRTCFGWLQNFQESLCLQLYELSMGTCALTDPKRGQRTSENAIVRERGVSCSAKPSACRELNANAQ